MLTNHQETQEAIKDVVREYVRTSPLSAPQISVELFNKGRNYLYGALEKGRIVGPKFFRHLSTVINFPKGLARHVTEEHEKRQIIKGMKAGPKGNPPPWKHYVIDHIENKAVEHKAWRKDS